ncbi:MAG: M10 family metallopeptidase C-terminal domain-containing protein [Cyanobacteriota bacterium]|nr:M10 family metallopeptidase C-terminal domain-containing protein [Cyanobacteriota bacterium]
MEINGTNDSESLNGGVENDSIQGFSGNDSLFGGVGDDSLVGGFGDDIFNGGAGADIFVYQQLNGSGARTDTDTIVDFELGVDRIDVSILEINDFDDLLEIIEDNANGDAIISSFSEFDTNNLIIRVVGK